MPLREKPDERKAPQFESPISPPTVGAVLASSSSLTLFTTLDLSYEPKLARSHHGPP